MNAMSFAHRAAHSPGGKIAAQHNRFTGTVRTGQRRLGRVEPVWFVKYL